MRKLFVYKIFIASICVLVAGLFSACAGNSAPAKTAQLGLDQVQQKPVQDPKANLSVADAQKQVDSLYQKLLGDLGEKSIQFDFNTFLLTPEARQFLKEVAQILKKNPSLALILEGHADNRGTLAYNYELGMQRALSVQKYLLEFGVAVERLPVRSQGELKPRAQGSSTEALAQNRRVEFIVTQKSSEDKK